MAKVIEKLTRSSGRITRFLINTDKTAKSKQTEEYLDARIQLIQSYWREYAEHHEQAFDDATPEVLQADYFIKDVFSDVEQVYMESVAILRERLRTCTVKTPPSHSSTRVESSETPQEAALKLPKISLPVFSGNYLEWPSYRDLFNSLVIQNDSIAPVQKLHYLQSSLSGEAKNLIKHLPTTNANYVSAWRILENRYDNKRILTHSCLTTIMTLRPMISETANELRKLLDTTTQSLACLENLGRPVNHWDDWLIYIVTQRLDCQTRKDWENTLDSTTEVPEFKTLVKFLEGRLRTLEMVKTFSSDHKTKPQPLRLPTAIRAHNTITSKHCVICGAKHFIIFCPKFRAKTVVQRKGLVEAHTLCPNCLKPGHLLSSCQSTGRCKACNQHHHTMLHDSDHVSQTSQGNSNADPSTFNQSTKTFNVGLHTQCICRPVLLATARILIGNKQGQTLQARALLDPGSEMTFVSEYIAKALSLYLHSVQVPIFGIKDKPIGASDSAVTLNIRPFNRTRPSFEVTALVLPSLSSALPTSKVTYTAWPHIQVLPLADPEFSKPSPVDMVIGVELYSRLIRQGMRRGPPGTPVAQNTYLGWILSGPVESKNNVMMSRSVNLHLRSAVADDISQTLRRFWEIEELPSISYLSPDEASCEDFFTRTTQRDQDGRYIVRLPKKDNIIPFGNTRNHAVACLLRLETRFATDPELRSQYHLFLEEYLSLGHMIKVPEHEKRLPAGRVFYLPHHAVLKPSSTTTKLRVVFNASFKSSSGVSLNDCLHTGPKLQLDLWTIIMRWRRYPYVYTADIEKMFRQILVPNEDSNLQRIVWRDSPSAPIEDYKLVTVTYGTSPAPFLACRTLRQLSLDHHQDYPAGSEILLNHFYVDDALFGDYDLQSTIKKRNELNQLLKRGGFTLRKWAANKAELLQDIPNQDKEVCTTAPKLLQDDQIKTLGMLWYPGQDSFRVSIPTFEQLPTYTKRNVLSDIGKLFDPLGWLSPVVIKAKVFLQTLWLAKLEWDEELPTELATDWHDFRSQLNHLEHIEIPRWLGTKHANIDAEIHGFCDASTLAYSGAVYLRILAAAPHTGVNLLASKTKVAPLKTISVPRLELCGANLLTKLINSVVETMGLQALPIYAWTDSSIVLTWLKSHPSKWKTFIANRVSAIQTTLPNCNWRYVPTSDNPADCASRGLYPDELKNHPLWWHGPPWLQQSSTYWPKNILDKPADEDLESTQIHCGLTRKLCKETWSLLNRYSSLERLLRVTAWCQRFALNCKAKNNKVSSSLTAAELERSLIFWIAHVQHIYFNEEIQSVQLRQPLPKRSKLLTLRPILDKDNLLRVGGRIRNSYLSYSESHPIIIPSYSYLDTLIIADAHKKTLHGGPQLMLQHLRSKFWIINARQRVRSYTRKCVRCIRYRTATHNQQMGDLPTARVQPSKPFEHVGIDYAGPIAVTALKHRGAKSHKSYIALFVCFATRAVHLELVMGLTSEAFIAAFRRFISRRGRCSHVYSDNATNFVGADKILRKHLQDALAESSTSVRNFLSNEGVTWHFIPPVSPHMGGIWEAGIKSVKHHLRRVIGSTILCVEEMNTLLAEIEACLNSRPICPLNDDPEDSAALTPGHFLMGCAPLSVPEPTPLDSTGSSPFHRWVHVQTMVRHFWTTWHKDYLNYLQQRRKWQTEQPQIKVDDLALIRDNQLPPCEWALARVTNIYPGQDGLTRVVQLRVGGTYVKRHIRNLCVLPNLSQN